MRRVQRLIVLEPGIAELRREQLEAGLRAVGEPDRHGAVHLNDGRWAEPAQRLIQERDLPPVGPVGIGRLEVERGDRRLQLILARAPHPERALEHPGALMNPSLIP